MTHRFLSRPTLFSVALLAAIIFALTSSENNDGEPLEDPVQPVIQAISAPEIAATSDCIPVDQVKSRLENPNYDGAIPMADLISDGPLKRRDLSSGKAAWNSKSFGAQGLSYELVEGDGGCASKVTVMAPISSEDETTALRAMGAMVVVLRSVGVESIDRAAEIRDKALQGVSGEGQIETVIDGLSITVIGLPGLLTFTVAL